MAKRNPLPPARRPDDDAQLMARTACGDTVAFEELVRRHQARVYNLVYRSVGNPSDAEDLVQEIFFRVYRGAPRYQPTARFTTWLYRVSMNAVINWLRRHDQQPVELSRLGVGEDGEGGAGLLVDRAGVTGLEAVAQGEVRAQVRRAIETLPPNQRLALILFRFEGLSYQKTAEAMSCSVMAVKSLLSRARENLRTRLAAYLEGESGPAPQLPGPGTGSRK